MPTTILQSLTRPNPKIYRYTVQPGLSSSEDWTPIESVRIWEDFTYNNLAARYKDQLKKIVSSWEPNDCIKSCNLHEIVSEDSVVAFSVANSMLPVGNALNKANRDLILGAASKFCKKAGAGNPDWGCGWADEKVGDRDNF